MKEQRITLTALAKELDLTHQAVMRWLAPDSKSKPYPKTRIALASLLNVRLDWLFYGEGEREIPNGARGQLRSAREQIGMTAQEVAKAIGYQIGVYQAVEQGTARISENMAEQLSKVLPVSKEELMGGSDFATVLNESPAYGTFGSKPQITLPPGSSARYVPLLSWAQAGAFDACHEDGGYDYQGVIAMDIKDPKAFGISVRGNSMEPRIVEGDSIIVCPSWVPRSGDTVAAKSMSGDVLCKIYQPQKAGEIITLSSYNIAYPALTFKRSELRWVYPVGQVIQNLRRD